MENIQVVLDVLGAKIKEQEREIELLKWQLEKATEANKND